MVFEQAGAYELRADVRSCVNARQTRSLPRRRINRNFESRKPESLSCAGQINFPFTQCRGIIPKERTDEGTRDSGAKYPILREITNCHETNAFHLSLTRQQRFVSCTVVVSVANEFIVPMRLDRNEDIYICISYFFLTLINIHNFYTFKSRINEI